MGTTHTQLKVLLYCLTMECDGYVLLYLITSNPFLRLLFTLPRMSYHTSCLLGSLFCIIYKSDLLHIWTAVETYGLRLSCVTHIKIGRSSIFTAAFDSVCNGIQWIHIFKTTVLLRLLTNSLYY